MSTSGPLLIICPACVTANRVPCDKIAGGPKCGRCGKPLFTGLPITLTSRNFDAHLLKSGVPLVVDFWAAWCGPCRQMAPAFEAAAVILEPHVRLGKLDTEAEQAIASRYAIRSIPTMVMFADGKEIARQTGAMPAHRIVEWVQQRSNI